MADVETQDGLTLYAESHGDGPPVVFSCAFCTTRENWRGQVAPLVAAGYRVILWDFRGHGLSQAPHDAERYSIEHVVDDLSRVLDWAAPGETAVLAGLSFGGLASLHFTLRWPERVRALMLIDSGPGFKKPEAAAEWQRRSNRTADFLAERGFEAFVSGKAGATCIGRTPEAPAARAAAAAIVAQDPTAVGLFGRHVAGPAPPVIDDLARMDVPALVLVGEEDRPYLAAGEVMAARLPRSQHVVLAGAGHIGNIERPAEFNAIAIAFLAGLPVD